MKNLKLTGQKFFDSSVTDGGPDGHDNEDDETRRPGPVHTQVFHLRNWMIWLLGSTQIWDCLRLANEEQQ